MPSIAVTAIHLHPIKACHRVEVPVATVSETGLAGDREWQVSAGLIPATQREHPVLATVQPEPIDGGLRLSAPGRSTIDVERPTVADAVTGSLVGVEVDVGDAGDDAARWFSELVGADVRLYARTPSSELKIPELIDVFDQTIAFSDVAPVLVATTASLDWLAARASEPFGMDRFRPNLVLDGAEPFAEDTWARFRVGAAELRHGLPWPRCAVPQVDQDRGERRKEPAKALRAHRWCTDAPTLAPAIRAFVENNGIFGVGCSIGPVGTEIAIGDTVEITETMEPIVPAPAEA